jgi:hypothetical protein
MDWNIQSRAHACSECGARFADRETLHTLLFRDTEGFARVDVCVKCWESQFAEGANHRRGFISHWQTVHVIPSKEPEPIQRASAETLLRQLLERNLPEFTGACFVLAVMLERKRVLKPQGRSTENGRRILHYEHAKSGDVFHIVDPDLQLDQLETVQRQVAYLLEHGLPADPADAETAGEVPATPGDSVETDSVETSSETSVGEAVSPEADAGERPDAAETRTSEEAPKVADGTASEPKSPAEPAPEPPPAERQSFSA